MAQVTDSEPVALALRPSDSERDERHVGRVKSMRTMLSVEEAQKVVLDRVGQLSATPTAVTTAALGSVLAEDVVADIDSPPFDKSLVDGYAVRSSDCSSGDARLQVVGEVVAGQKEATGILPGQALRVMTGAAIPEGADAVVMHEDCESVGPHIRVRRPVQPGCNIFRRGQEIQRGQKVLLSGHVLTPAAMAVLATVGRIHVLTIRQPVVAIVSTGDELVEPAMTPGSGQIRNSNGTYLTMAVARAGGLPRYLGIARDRSDSLHPLLMQGLQADVLLVSGGVSAGRLDLVPDALRLLGVHIHFHKLALKPGKPLLFGTHGQTAVFGLPGNPVSTLAGFHLLVRPALRKLMGKKPVLPLKIAVPAIHSLHIRTDRPTYHPARLMRHDSSWQVQLLPWQGSPDLRTMTEANCFALIPPGEHQIQPGQILSVFPLEDDLAAYEPCP
ncbi:MAG: molybdenum cofactor biosynthesis protein [Gemmataceae bacterium]